MNTIKEKYLLITGEDKNACFTLEGTERQVINSLEEMLDSVIDFCISYGLDSEELIEKIKEDCYFDDKDVEIEGAE